MKKRNLYRLCLLCAVLVLLFGAFLALKWDAIFQRGNPLPYLLAAVRLSDDNPYAPVGTGGNLYITVRGDKDALFEMIQSTFRVEFQDQLGSGYLFSDGESTCIVGSEIYWGRFTVWTLPFDGEFPR